jgi:small GTP-binding protein
MSALPFSGSSDTAVRVWDVETGRCMRILEGHTDSVTSVAWGRDNRRSLSGAADKTVRVWDVETGRCLRILEGHTANIQSVAWSADQRYVLSGADDRTARLWDAETGQCLVVLKGHSGSVVSVAWSTDPCRAFSGGDDHSIRIWNLSEFLNGPNVPEDTLTTLPGVGGQIQYTNAKVLLVGETGAGKTALSKVLAGGKWEATDSTVGAWATHWKLPVTTAGSVEREIWLWDFGGQADQRLIHQLYMEDTALAVLVFDGQKEDLFETLGQWDHDITRASRKPFVKVLAAARVDAGGLRVSRNQIEQFVKERGFVRYLETSAKANLGCQELKEAILGGILWANIPWRSSPLLFKRLKDEILHLKDEGRVLMRFNELRDALRLRLTGEDARFKDEELKAVVGLLTGPGVVLELAFGSWVLLQPERINSYAQAVIQTFRADEYERGCLPEERVLSGDLAYHSSVLRLGAEEERFVLLAMHQALLERSLCLREHTENGPVLIFPSYYRRERPNLVEHPAVLVSYRFNGFLDDIYATLVVRLHHTKPFRQNQLWRYAADFKTLTGKQLGFKLTRRAEGAGELAVYFDPGVTVEEKIIFSRYIHEHLLQKAQDIVRLRHYICPLCATLVGNLDVARERLEAWLGGKATDYPVGGFATDAEVRSTIPTIICSRCEERVPLWDELEKLFASEEMQRRVQQLQEQTATVLSKERGERTLAGEVISTVTLAGQICRELTVSDHGIDFEIEFNDDTGATTGKKLFIQLRSTDSYEYKRRGQKEVFAIRDELDARYWITREFPVMLVIRALDGNVSWMNVREWLISALRATAAEDARAKQTSPSQESDGVRKLVKEVVFDGDRFDVMSVRRWRDKALREVR